MPISPRHNLLCSYRYDALDRSINWAPIRQAGIQRFHCNDRLATEIQGSVKYSIFHHDNQVLGQQQHLNDQLDITLLATDLQGSILNALDANRSHSIAYTPYGHHLPTNGLLSLLGFNGERPDPMTGHYHLGHGYRQFNPVLMRFNSPDSLSPFGKGGLNAYAYCSGQPVQRVDPTGRNWQKLVETLNVELFKNTGRQRINPYTFNAIKKHSIYWKSGTKTHKEMLEGLVSDHRHRHWPIGDKWESPINWTDDHTEVLRATEDRVIFFTDLHAIYPKNTQYSHLLKKHSAYLDYINANTPSTLIKAFPSPHQLQSNNIIRNRRPFSLIKAPYSPPKIESNNIRNGKLKTE